MGAQGTTTINFGAFPGASDTSVAVASAAILAGSLVEAWIFPVATADHTVDEHMVETLKVFAANIVAGVGFTIYGFNTSEIFEPLESMGTTFLVNRALQAAKFGGRGTRLYGQFTVAWVWN
jgi:hypothetical protein